jgi:hypothetical protein
MPMHCGKASQRWHRQQGRPDTHVETTLDTIPDTTLKAVPPLRSSPPPTLPSQTQEAQTPRNARSRSSVVCPMTVHTTASRSRTFSLLATTNPICPLGYVGIVVDAHSDTTKGGAWSGGERSLARSMRCLGRTG